MRTRHSSAGSSEHIGSRFRGRWLAFLGPGKTSRGGFWPSGGMMSRAGATACPPGWRKPIKKKTAPGPGTRERLLSAQAASEARPARPPRARRRTRRAGKAFSIAAPPPPPSCADGGSAAAGLARAAALALRAPHRPARHLRGRGAQNQVRATRRHVCSGRLGVWVERALVGKQPWARRPPAEAPEAHTRRALPCPGQARRL